VKKDAKNNLIIIFEEKFGVERIIQLIKNLVKNAD